MKTWICNPSYIYGNEKKNYKNLSNFYEKLNDYDMPDMPDFWGWGSYHVSTQSRYELANTAIARCFALNLPPKIDHVIICSCEISDTFMASNDDLNTLLSNHGLTDIPISGVSLTGCNNIFSSMVFARALLLGNIAKNVLIVSEDTAKAEELRFDKHCIFSDGACAFILSKEINSGIELVDVDIRFCPENKESGQSIFRADLNRIKTAYTDFLLKHQLSESDLSTIIAPNYYPPLLDVLFNSVGIDSKKRFPIDVSLNGHCFSCDYLINLTKFISLSAEDENDILLFAYADMHYGFCLINSYVNRL